MDLKLLSGKSGELWKDGNKLIQIRRMSGFTRCGVSGWKTIHQIQTEAQIHLGFMIIENLLTGDF